MREKWKNLTPEQAAAAIKEAQDEVDRIEGEIDDLETELHFAELNLRDLKAFYPSPPEPPPLPRVMTFVCDGTTWYTDGYRAFPDDWPGEYRPIEGDPGDVGRDLVHDCEAYMPTVQAVEEAGEFDGFGVLIFDNGALLRRDWVDAVTSRGGVDVCSMGPLKPAALKDNTGRVLAILMPLNASDYALKDRRPIGPSTGPSSAS